MSWEKRVLGKNETGDIPTPTSIQLQNLNRVQVRLNRKLCIEVGGAIKLILIWYIYHKC